MNSANPPILHNPLLGKGESASCSFINPTRISVRQNLPQTRVEGASSSRSQPNRVGVYNVGRRNGGGVV